MVGLIALFDRLANRLVWVRAHALAIALVLSAILLIGRGIQGVGNPHGHAVADPGEVPVCLP